MRWFGQILAVGSVGAVLALTGCSGSSSSSAVGAPALLSFNLGRSQVSGSNTITAGVFVNEPLIFEFSTPIDPSSVSFDTIQIVRPDTGEFAPGTFTVEGPRVIFRPDVTFDRANPTAGLSFGFDFLTLYLVAIPGQPRENLIRSADGTPIRQGATLEFTTATRGAEDNPFDFFPGTPKVTLIKPQGTPDPTNPNIIVTDVPVDSEIVLGFSEPIDPATALGTVPGESNTVIIQVDLDGDPSTGGSEDRVRVPGTYLLDISSTDAEMTFRLPSGRRYPGSAIIVVTVGGSIADVAGNQSGQTVDFFYSTVSAPPGGSQSVRENFEREDFEDKGATGAYWDVGRPVNEPGGDTDGVLRPGFGGGFAIHGEFAPTSDVTLNTDSQVITDLFGNQVTVRDGTFYFTRVSIPAGVTVRGVGSKPLRIFSTGDVIVNGTIDVSGLPGSLVFEEQATAGLGGVGGPGGLRGGDGGEPDDGSTFFIDDGQSTCGDPEPILPGDGHDGLGDGAGKGAIGISDTEVLCNNFTFIVAAATGGGGGGGYATAGTAGSVGSNFFGCINPVHDNRCYPAPGNCLARPPGDGGTGGHGTPTLRPLVGGSGGGGGGNNFFGSRGNGLGNSECLPLADRNPNPGSGGGGGGGALQLQAGRKLTIKGSQSADARIVADGGTGGPANIEDGPSGPRADDVTTGGGGSGGGILLQAAFDNSRDGSVSLTLSQSKLNAIGGEGGTRAGDPKFKGGPGGLGRIRIEAVDPDNGITFVVGDVTPCNACTQPPSDNGTVGAFTGSGFSAARSAFYDSQQLLPIFEGFQLRLNGQLIGFNTSIPFANDLNSLPSTGVLLAFQGASASAQGGPNESTATDWTLDIRQINDRQFFRFIVVFLNGLPTEVDDVRVFYRGR